MYRYKLQKQSQIFFALSIFAKIDEHFADRLLLLFDKSCQGSVLFLYFIEYD